MCAPAIMALRNACITREGQAVTPTQRVLLLWSQGVEQHGAVKSGDSMSGCSLVVPAASVCFKCKANCLVFCAGTRTRV